MAALDEMVVRAEERSGALRGPVSGQSWGSSVPVQLWNFRQRSPGSSGVSEERAGHGAGGGQQRPEADRRSEVSCSMPMHKIMHRTAKVVALEAAQKPELQPTCLIMQALCIDCPQIRRLIGF